MFALRENIGKTQSEIMKEISDKFGIRFRYGDIERGNAWSVITSARAEILAVALKTTPEHILSCERSEGGYVGELYSGSSNKHQLRIGKHNRRQAYSEALSTEERCFSEHFYGYVCRAINCMKKHEFALVLSQHIIDEDELDEVGMLSFLKAVKFIFSEQLQSEEEKKIKGIISFRIKWGILKHIKNMLCEKRKAYADAYRLDESISENADYCLYDIVPDTSSSFADTVDSSCILTDLYSYLSEKQRTICRYLIKGYTQKELLRSGIATETDIGVIAFYLAQMRSYGKILWTKEQYVSECKGVHYCFGKNKWLACTFFQKKNYNLGYYDNLSDAINIKEAAEYHCHLGDFPEWINRFKKSDRTAFIEEAASEQQVTSIKQRHTIAYSTLDKPVGVSYRSSRDAYEVTIKGTYLGTVKSLQEGVSLRNEAADHIRNGNFDLWLAMRKKEVLTIG